MSMNIMKRTVKLITREKGSGNIMLKQYREGKLPLGSLAKGLDISVGEAIDLLAEIGIGSPVTYEDYLKGFEVKW